MTSRTSYTQYCLMVEFMEKHGDLSKPTNLVYGRQWAIKMWRNLTLLLNSQGVGQTRNEEKWRKVWTDLKNNTKRKWAKIQRSVQGTGGGPALKLCLTDIENRVLSIMGVQAAVGMSVAEVGFGMVEQCTELELPTQTETVESVSKNVCEEYWNTPGTSSSTPIVTSIPMAAPPKSPTPLTSPTIHHDTPQLKKKKNRFKIKKLMNTSYKLKKMPEKTREREKSGLLISKKRRSDKGI